MRGIGPNIGLGHADILAKYVKALFGSGIQGAFCNFQDTTSLFQDVAFTVPAVPGQPVMGVLDRSGNGNHFIQPISASAPILQKDPSGAHYLNFDGINDFLQSAATINLSASDKVSSFIGIRKASDAAIQIAAEFSASTGANAGSFYFTAPETVLNTDFGFKSRGSTNTNGPARTAAGAFPAPITAVLTGLGDIGGSRSILRLNGVERSNITDAQGVGSLGNYTMYLGARAGTSLFFSGRIYSFAMIAKACSNSEISIMEAYINSAMRAY